MNLDQGKTWAENAIDHWMAMEPGDESERLLLEILREYRKDLRSKASGGPRRLRPQTVLLRRLNRHEKRRERMSAFGVANVSRASDTGSLSSPPQFSSTTTSRRVHE